MGQPGRGLIILLLLGFAPVVGATEHANPDRYERLPSRLGDRCIVCDKRIDEHGLSILYRGRRVPVAGEDMLQAFLEDPERYFRRLEPRGALFQEDAIRDARIHPAWLIVGVWVLLALVSAALSVGLALRKGLPAVRWFFTGLALSVFGLLWAWSARPATSTALPPRLAKLPVTATPVPCRRCGAENHPTARSCSGCGSSLHPAAESDLDRLSRA